jgi:glycosyltransferase involved in cell wall biosynthesis
MSEKKAKIVMITMFKNEAKVIRRMLESCKPYVDFYVMQDNGSTDGTTDIAKQFLVENKLDGHIYFCEEGWKGFGWNRDHLIQYCQSIDHGCDWILKMDCDEMLEVDNDFDWSILDNKSIQSFHIPAVAGTSIYYRAWMYNANLPWRFNHDPCHETVYCDIEGIKENFERYDLPNKFRQIGFNEGQSWSDPLKFALHALVLEEKMMREGNMLDNMYHFWYIGKSYFDAFPSSGFPLQNDHQREYARRTIFYFEQYIQHVLNYWRGGDDEMCYLAEIFKGDTYKFLGENDNAIKSYLNADKFAVGRNDHWYCLADLHKNLEQYNEMLKYTSIMMQPERTNPFPKYVNFIDSSMYNDSPTQRIQQMHQFALEKVQESGATPLQVNDNKNDRLFIVDNFYKNPDEVRNFALTQVEYNEDLRWYKGLRSTKPYRTEEMKKAFEQIIGRKIINWEEFGTNGCFQITTAKDPQVYHYDQQTWAGMIYLTPNAPLESGTRLMRSKINGTRHSSEPDVDLAFNGNFYDSTKFDVADSAGNIYNRLVIMDARCIHSAGPYFGSTPEDGRLIHLFFFDTL